MRDEMMPVHRRRGVALSEGVAFLGARGRTPGRLQDAMRVGG